MSERQLFEICPDCNGNGFIAHMAANPTLDETIEECTRCEDWKGMVPVEPDRETALNVLSTYRRLVLMGAEDTYEATLDALSAALGIGGSDA